MPITATATRRNDHDITVRRMDLTFDESTPTYWFDDNPYLTSILNALAIPFPPGERDFIRSVRHFLPQVEDTGLRAAVRAFIGQEANHTKEHIAFNQFLEDRGFPARAMEDFVTQRLETMHARSTPAENLARTAALEHFTAILAHSLLDSLPLVETMSPEAARLWVWHAIEEIEHRSVAFDVYETAVGDEKLRLRVMVQATFFFLLMNSLRARELIKRSDPAKRGLRPALRAANVLFGKPGVFRKVLPLYVSYYRRGFHPSDHDNREVVERAKARYLSEAA